MFRHAVPPALLLGCIVGVACGSSPAAEPAGIEDDDAGAPPAKVKDASRPFLPDDDSGDTTPDADMSVKRDAAPGQLAADCKGLIDDVYVTPSGLSAMTPAARGDVVRCAFERTMTPANVVQDLTDAKVDGVTATSGADIYRIAFRTTRASGAGGLSSARVYLPRTPKRTPLPVIVAAHPTTGLGPACTPSKMSDQLRDLALPWASLGYAVIAPDFAGQGTEGVQGYVDNRDTGYSTLDAARALRKLLAPGTFSPQVLMVGFSQGGGAVLSAQALEKTYGTDGKIAAVIAISPEWQTRANSFGYVDMLKNPDKLTITTGLSQCVVASMRSYAYFANTFGLAQGGDGFPATGRSELANATATLCEEALGAFVQINHPHLRDLFDDALRTSLIVCIDGGIGDSGCVDPGKSYFDYLQANVLTGDPAGAPVLYVQGLLDTIMPPAQEAACTIAKLSAEGVSVQACTDGLSTHLNAPPRNIAFGITWGEAVLGGGARPTCSSFGMPSCTP